MAFKALMLPTDNGNFFVSVHVNKNAEYLYMDKYGNFVPSKRELDPDPKKVTPQEWAWAKKDWGAQEQILTSKEDEKRVFKALAQRTLFLEKAHRAKKLETEITQTSYSVADIWPKS